MTTAVYVIVDSLEMESHVQVLPHTALSMYVCRVLTNNFFLYYLHTLFNPTQTECHLRT